MTRIRSKEGEIVRALCDALLDSFSLPREVVSMVSTDLETR